MRFILRPLLSELGYTDNSDDDDIKKCLRQEAARWACTFGDLNCQHIATDLLQKHLKYPNENK